jgi:hypothetical protein
MNGDKSTDLVVIKKTNTTNKKVQIKVLAGSSGYSTVFEESTAPLDFQLADWNGDGN